MSKKKKSQNDKDDGFKSEPVSDKQKQSARPGVWFSNYDHTLESADETSPGGGLWMNMHKYKSVSDFKKRKEKEKEKSKKAMIVRMAKLICMLGGND